MFISYDDDAPQSEFLGRYGFLPADNPCDAVELAVPAGLFADPALETALAAVQVWDAKVLRVPRQPFGCPLVHGVRVLHMTPDERADAAIASQYASGAPARRLSASAVG